MNESIQKTLLALLLLYGMASLIHFVHNAEFLTDYPNLPDTWTRLGVYYAWIGVTATGVCGWLLLNRGYPILGLLVLAIYAVFGLDSLGHYVVARMSEHTLAMNVTIMLEVIAASMVLIVILTQFARLCLRKQSY